MGKTKVILSESKYWNQMKKLIVESQKEDFEKTGNKNVETMSKIMDVLLENQRHQILTENFITAGDIQPVVRVILGLTKKFFPKLIQNDVVSVQPMNGPVQVVKMKKVIIDGQEVPNFSLNTPDHLPQNDLTLPRTLTLTQNVGTTDTQFTFSLPQFQKIVQGSVSVSYGSTVLTDVNGVISNQEIYGTINYDTGVVTLRSLTGSTISNVTVSVLTSGLEVNTDVPRMRFEITNLPINQITRKLRQSWTYEQLEDQQQELGGFMNFEDEIYDDVSSFIQQEINREIINDLVQGQQSQGNVGSWTYQTPTQIGYQTQEAYYRTLLYTINGVQQQITRKIKIQEPNFVVVSPYVWQIISDGLNNYSWKQGQGNVNYQTVGYSLQGNINNKYNVYVTPSIPDDVVLVGFKGKSIVDSGYVYQPYIPLKQVPVTHEPVPGLQFYTRYGKKLYQPWFYGVVNITY